MRRLSIIYLFVLESKVQSGLWQGKVVKELDVQCRFEPRLSDFRAQH